jgi:putative ABC transport system ATP-binding protein
MTYDAPVREAVTEPQDPRPAAARVIDLVKSYGTGEAQVQALDGVTLDLEAGVFTAIMGPSGSGKSTLMHCMAALDTPSAGRVIIDGIDISHLKDKALTRLRRDRLGFVFQAYNLIPTLTARENITLPMDIAGTHADPAWFDTVIDTLAIRDRLTHRPDELSGGQQQRVASSSPTNPPATSTHGPAPRSCPSCARRSTTSVRPS